MAFNSTPKTAPPEAIAILGSGCRFPGGADSPAKLWELLKQPRDLLTAIPKRRLNIDAFYHPDGTHPGSTNVRHSYFLEENIHAFDATFFGIKPSEADCIDPQQRILLETVFEALSNAGQKLETLAGSQTAVYCGLMCNDHSDNIKQDLNAAPIYSATGTAASIQSIRVSYFFDWHDDNRYRLQLFSRCRANLILGPGAYVLESKLNMLSPDGRSRMWDAAANGYARGEGVAAVVLKTLSKAIRDGDHIDCIIRETGINQDNRSPGITMPNHAAHTALIKDTYARAGLDAANPLQRCQYFEAHGTGTPAGDPQEAEAIDTAFFPKRSRAPNEEPLYVGSIKTVIGHTEGTAGIAGLMKASSALQSATIPPNMLFDNLAPRVAPFYKDVRIVTRAQAWPAVVPGAPRRASVNSFGFGGTNAHAILESYEATETTTTHSSGDTSVLPLVVSTNTERTLKANLKAILGYLEDDSCSININELAQTLFLQRSTISLRVSLPAIDRVAAIRSISSELIAMDKKSGTALRSDAVTRAPSILGIFTGQGAQWPTMGKGLITHFSRAHTFVKDLDRSLQTLPIEYRPCWTIEEQLQLEDAQSNVLDAEYSQPLCCAVQLILIDLLTTAGVHFKAVVGHSSGEIACAFAAGFLTSSQAIRVAHLRGLTSKLASSPSRAAGSMLASGTSLGDAYEICALDMFEGRLCVAASNSPSSVTFSGDSDAILELKDMLDDESTFARLLKVDKAYHSHHMLSCAESYIAAMQECVPRVALVQSIPHPEWLSSVHQGKVMRAEDVTPTYWRDNLVSPVLFSQAVEQAVVDFDPLEMAMEVGCHPALKSPCLATIQAAVNMELPYVGCMERKGNDILAFQAALGFLWQRSGPAGFDATHWLSIMSPRATAESTTKSLPRYAWDNSKTYSIESRATRNHLHDISGRHPLLGKLSGNSTSSSLQWHQYLRQRDISWLDGHQLQGQTVFPGAGYAVMAMEAAAYVANGRPIRLLEILDLSIGKAITFDDENSMVELQFIMSALPEQTSDTVVMSFSCDSCLAKEQQLSWSAGGKIVITLGEANADALPSTVEPPHMNSVYIDAFYSELAALGYGYTKDFRGLQTVKRADKQSRGTIKLATFAEHDRALILHPATLDVAFQAFIGAFMYPGDGSLTSLHVPVAISRIAVNPYLIAQAHAAAKDIHFSSAITPNLRQMIGGDVELTTEDLFTLLQVEGIRFKPLSPPTADDDKKLFQKWVWGPYDVDPVLAKPELRANDTEKKAAYDLERLVFYYVRSYLERRSTLAPAGSMPAYMEHYDRWCTHVMAIARSGGHPWYETNWEQDTADLVAVVCNSVIGIPDTEITRRTGVYLLAGDIDPGSFFRVLNHDGLLTTFYETNMSSKPGNSLMVDLVRQLSHRYQNMDILEPGGGTGGATKQVMKGCEGAFNSYMFTDISADFFESAKSIFPGELGDRADFATLDITSEPTAQGFSAASYDLIIAANVLHATPALSKTLRNVRTMMKPGGRLMLLELTNPASFRSGFVFGLFSGWWAGVEEGRTLEPFVTIDQWSALLQHTGFTAVNNQSEDADSPEFPVSLFSAQAVSERTITVVTRWEDLLEADIPTKATFLVLADLDQQLFVSLEEENFEAVKMLLVSAANILWITDSVVEKPYHAVSVGFLRSLRLEYNDVNIQTLELDGPCERAHEALLSALVRLESERVWVPEGIVWTNEPELSFKDGKLTIPRLMTDAVRNNRLNSGRRKIETIHERGSLNVALIRDEQVSYLTQVLDTRTSHRSPVAAKQIGLQVLQSSSHAIKIGAEGYFYVVKGQRDDSSAPVFALADSIASTVTVSPEAIFSPTQELTVLDVVMEAVSIAILDGLVAGSAVVGLDSPRALIQPLLRRARKMKVAVRLLSTTGTEKNEGDTLTLTLHDKELNADIVRRFPKTFTRFVDLSGETSGPTGIAARVIYLLPSSCRSRLRYADLFSLSTTTVSPAGAEDLNAAASRLGPELVPALQAGTVELSDDIVDLTPDDSDTETTIPTGSSGSSDIDTVDVAVLSPGAVLTPPTFYGSLDAGHEKANPFELLSIEVPEVTREEVMSFGQARFWLMRHLVDDPSAFNVTVGLWMTGQISLERLGNAVNAAVQRHETYRTRFYEPEGRSNRPMQAVLRQTRMKSENVAVHDKEAALEGFRAMEHHVYDLVTGDTTRVVDFHWAEDQHFLVIAYHHIVSDGWSYEMLFNEIAKIYAGESLPPAPQYADFAARQRLEYDNGLMESDLAYWDAQYKILPPVLSLLPLSQTKTRSMAVAWSYHEDTVRLQPMVAARIKDRSRKHKATPIHLYLAAFHVLLARLTGNDDIVIGGSDASRTSLDDISTCGFYVNLLPIRQQYDTASTFGGAVTQAKTQIQNALLHSKPTFDLLLQRLNIARASTHSPLFQVGFDYKQGQAESGRIGGADITDVLMSRSRTAYDITLEVLDDPSKDPMITFKLQSSIYAKEDVKPLLKSYVNLVTAFSRNPALRVEEVQLFSRSELTKSQQLGKGPTVPTQWEPTLIDRLIAHAAVAPNDTALASPEASLTFAALVSKINDIAAHLQSIGVKAGSKVISTLSPTLDWICAFYAVMKCGAVYCPVDPTDPAARLATMFEDCQPAAVFVNTTLAADSLPIHKAATVRIDEVSKVSEIVPCQASFAAACVVLYTSGTTGAPKGHILSHAGILNNVEGTYRLLGAMPQRVLQHSAQTFDMSIWQALLGPATGGMTFVVPAESRRDSHKVSVIIAEQKITCTVATPLEYSSWISVGSEHLKSAASYTSALTGGEALSTTVLEHFRSLHLQDLKVFNSYGPAETCFYSSAIEIDYRSALPERLPLGHTIPNYSVYILDEERRPVAPGFPGDIFIGGPSVGLGYLNRPDLTAAGFIPDTFSSAEEKAQGHHTLFCTGDRGRLRSDGALLFDGRGGEATQIKLRGMRVELTDIERSILATSEGALTEAICSLRGKGEAAYLVAHVVFTPTHPPADRAALLRRLRNSIPVPGYMRPAMMLELDSLPLTQHFKVDRRAIAALPLPENTLATRDSLSGLTTDEAWLWGIWSEVLASEVVASVTPTAEVDFIEAGGNSILIVQLHALLQQSIGVRMPLVEMFENTALGEMVQMVQMHREGKE
ncbi:hypothetical protein B0A48_15551 [Cryoendolithus antarcticus]|uniref:Uncharacterized protein n=1 Tax=Cryoendolithus antarcticus TaxID=1507870 RepID=A0A1V8SGK8_9PEZI|nr:hypothetical protein B0A48_15551 [Cryoendolithus antarcticus]